MYTTGVFMYHQFPESPRSVQLGTVAITLATARAGGKSASGKSDVICNEPKATAWAEFGAVGFVGTHNDPWN